jgi:hypothetical protein
MNTALISGRLARARSRSWIPDIPGIEKSTISTSIAGLASSGPSAAIPLEGLDHTVSVSAIAQQQRGNFAHLVVIVN